MPDHMICDIISVTFHESLPLFAVCSTQIQFNVSIFKYVETGESLSNVEYVCNINPMHRQGIFTSLTLHPTKKIFVTTSTDRLVQHVETWIFNEETKEITKINPSYNFERWQLDLYSVVITRSWLVNSDFILAIVLKYRNNNNSYISLFNYSYEHNEHDNSDGYNVTNKQIFKAHDDIITSIVFHPVKRLLISCSIDKSVKFWDITTFETRNFRNQVIRPPMTVQRYDYPVKSISISPHEPSLLVVATYNQDTTMSMLYLYNIRLESYNDNFKSTPYTEDASLLRRAQQQQRSPYQLQNNQILTNPQHQRLLGILPPSATSRNLGLSNKRKGGNKTKRNRHKKTRNFRSRSRSFHKKRKYSIRR